MNLDIEVRIYYKMIELTMIKVYRYHREIKIALKVGYVEYHHPVKIRMFYE